MAELVGINEKGRRIGQYHPRAKLTDHEVDLIFELYDEGRGLSMAEIARRFETRRSTINEIIKGRRRAQHPSRFKRVESTREVIQ